MIVQGLQGLMPVAAENKAKPTWLTLPFDDFAVRSERAMGLSAAFDHHANTKEPTVTTVAPEKWERPDYETPNPCVRFQSFDRHNDETRAIAVRICNCESS
jgi:hypothetical protein